MDRIVEIEVNGIDVNSDMFAELLRAECEKHEYGEEQMEVVAFEATEYLDEMRNLTTDKPFYIRAHYRKMLAVQVVVVGWVDGSGESYQQEVDIFSAADIKEAKRDAKEYAEEYVANEETDYRDSTEDVRMDFMVGDKKIASYWFSDLQDED